MNFGAASAFPAPASGHGQTSYRPAATIALLPLAPQLRANTDRPSIFDAKCHELPADAAMAERRVGTQSPRRHGLRKTQVRTCDKTARLLFCSCGNTNRDRALIAILWARALLGAQLRRCRPPGLPVRTRSARFGRARLRLVRARSAFGGTVPDFLLWVRFGCRGQHQGLRVRVR
jgi:hypothetical protein